MEAAEKTCCTCGLTRPVDEFYASRAHKDGKYPSCRTCAKARKSASICRAKALDPEGYRERRKLYAKRYRDRHPERVRAADARRNIERYGITADDYGRMLEAQGGACAVCASVPSGRALAVDHCHETGRVRGLLCDSCNLAIGQLGDTPATLRRAVAYLEGGSPWK